MAGLRAIWALAVKDLRLLARDRGALFLTFAWPLILACFFGALGPGFGALTGGESGGQGEGGQGEGSQGAMVVGFVDERADARSEALAEALDAHPRVRLEARTLAEAREAVREGAAPAYVQVHAASDDTSDTSEGLGVRVVVDPRRASEAELLESAVELAAWRSGGRAAPLTLSREVLAGPEGAAAGDPSHARPPSPYAVTFPQGIIWAVLACAATFALSLVNERLRGTLQRLAVAPLRRYEILAGKGLACLLAITAMQVVLMAVAVLGFGVRPQSWGLLTMALGCTSLGFVGVMTLLAAIGRKTASAAGMAWAILMAMAMLGGGMLPLFMMPPWLQAVAWASPVAWGLRAIEGAVWRGAGLVEVAGPCLALLGLGALCMALGSRIVREL
ncbi:ABC transporter permease [Pseudenhygromyxa sp. WMMC2535]|uniref:ABC transporter permease n=1 Tax=Pseudenhygromyxa sp. WMMC2535 TaxID=2712867 RepID=UPI001552B6CE|nr:ABC transporter permease [Pseudenhygromyxa sp. WMMC2535]NVB40999.1 ABC transporter permease [Pseudenhygromyxa sp. WMMC2535]